MGSVKRYIFGTVCVKSDTDNKKGLKRSILTNLMYVVSNSEHICNDISARY